MGPGRSQRLAIGIVLAALAMASAPSGRHARAGEVSPHERKFTQRVPARGFGGKPHREPVWTWLPPEGYRLVGLQGGLVEVVRKNLGGLNEIGLRVTRHERGVKVAWTLRNDTYTPRSGRTAKMTLRMYVAPATHPEASRRLPFSMQYWRLRQQFFDDFFYDGIVAEYIATHAGDRRGRTLHFGDCTIYMGQALVFLAAEAKLRRQTGLSPEPALQPIRQILEAVDLLDLKGETLYGAPGSINGFFVRDDMTGTDDPRLGDRVFQKVESDWQTPRLAAPSADQILGLMFGTAAVNQLSGDPAVAEHARCITARIFDYAIRCNFDLRLPNGRPVARGREFGWVAPIANDLHTTITGRDRSKEIRVNAYGLGFEQMRGVLGGLGSHGDFLAGLKLPFPGRSKEEILNSYVVHFLLMGAAASGFWSMRDIVDFAKASYHHLSPLYGAALRGDAPRWPTQRGVHRLLAAVPPQGPHGRAPKGSCWQLDNRWIRSNIVHKERGRPGHRFNGLDVLALHNLAALTFDDWDPEKITR